MKLTITLFTAFLLMFTACGSGNSNEYKLIGGPCAYESFTGTCRLTDVDGQGKGNFDFKGIVNGKEVYLNSNKTMLKIAMGVDLSCELKFITSGTCTPCLLSLGECGKDAWEAFRNYKGN